MSTHNTPERRGYKGSEVSSDTAEGRVLTLAPRRAPQIERPSQGRTKQIQCALRAGLLIALGFLSSCDATAGNNDDTMPPTVAELATPDPTMSEMEAQSAGVVKHNHNFIGPLDWSFGSNEVQGIKLIK